MIYQIYIYIYHVYQSMADGCSPLFNEHQGRSERKVGKFNEVREDAFTKWVLASLSFARNEGKMWQSIKESDNALMTHGRCYQTEDFNDFSELKVEEFTTEMGKELSRIIGWLIGIQPKCWLMSH